MGTIIESPKERNITVDILRGVAMLCVVLQHTMSGCVEGATDSFLFQIVWSLQMPLFMLISGYVTKYSSAPNSTNCLIKQLTKKTVAYLLPWFMWTFVVRGLLLGQTIFFDLKYLLWHMDSGYWFLTTLWAIVAVFAISNYIATKFKTFFVAKTIVYILGMAVLVGIGILFGLSFLGIKLTLYYMPFFYAGYIYSEIEKRFCENRWFENAKNVSGIICLAIWIAIISRINIFELGESIHDISLRIVSSLTGCIAVSNLISGQKIKIGGGIAWIGKSSLEIYTVHYLLLNLIKTEEPVLYKTPMGILLVAVNYFLTMALAIALTKVILSGKIAKKILYGKV